MGAGMRCMALALAAFSLFSALAGAPECADGEGRVPVSLGDTEVRSVESSIIGQEFKLHIYLPPGYYGTDRVFPAVYLTDSDAYFGFFRNMIAHLHFGRLVPAMVVIGIAYEEDTGSYLRKRERDLLPAGVEGRPGSGNAEAFVRFIKEELLPFVESQYRVDAEDRTIVGMSAGATFAAYVLCCERELFQRYVIVSPYFIYGQEVVLDLEAAYAKEHGGLSARVYTAMGESEPDYARVPWNALMDSVRKRDYPEVKLKQELLEGFSHMDVAFTAFVNGMKEVFSEGLTPLRAAPGDYASCPGSYDLGMNGMLFIVKLEDNRLLISKSGGHWDELIPVSKTRYGVREDEYVQFSFLADKSGRVVKMIMHQVGMDLPAQKTQ
jgi:predicted alpha/beta superfamily hydrolase